jgi:hypothetical protein
MKTQKKKRTIQTPASTGFYGLRSASVNAPTATYTAIDTPSDTVKSVMEAGQQQLAEQNEKAKEDAVIYAQKRKEYLEQQQEKENKRQSRGNILKGVFSTVGSILGSEFGTAGMAAGNILGSLTGEGIEALAEHFE